MQPIQQRHVPLVDISDDARKVARELGDALQHFGFVRITGVVSSNGINTNKSSTGDDYTLPRGLLTRAFHMARCFFELPIEAKQFAAVNERTRGYTPLGEETLDPERQQRGDTKEGFYIGRESCLPATEDERRRFPLEGPNVWPREEDAPGFRSTMIELHEALTALGLRLIRLVALALDLDGHFFDSSFKARPTALLRLLKYSSEQSDPERGIFAAGEHADYGALTLLATDGEPGLQVWDRKLLCWIDVPPFASPEQGFIVNIGDMLARWTNDRFPSTLHRVLNRRGRTRYAMPFFYEPAFDTLVQCLPSCCSADKPPKYSPVVSGQFLLGKYAKTHAHRGDQQSKVQAFE